MEERGTDEFFQRYDGRKDLGNFEPGDGARFKGRGPFFTTGRTNYKNFGDALKIDLVNEPQLAATPEVAFKIAALIWLRSDLNELADADNIAGVHQRIGMTGRASPQELQSVERVFRSRESCALTISPLSGREHKAWGVNPRKDYERKIQPATRVAEGSAVALSPVSRAHHYIFRIFPGAHGPGFMLFTCFAG